MGYVQEAMISFVRHAAKRDREEWRPFFYRCLWSRIRDWQRRRKVWRHLFRPFFRPHDQRDGTGLVELDNLPGPAEARPEKLLERQETRRRLLAGLAGLPLRQQEALLLHDWQGLTLAEPARAMGCSPSSVKTHRARGLAGLKRIIETEGG